MLITAMTITMARGASATAINEAACLMVVVLVSLLLAWFMGLAMAKDLVSVLPMPSPSLFPSDSTTSKWRVLETHQIYIDQCFNFAGDCVLGLQGMIIEV